MEYLTPQAKDLLGGNVPELAKKEDNVQKDDKKDNTKEKNDTSEKKDSNKDKVKNVKNEIDESKVFKNLIIDRDENILKEKIYKELINQVSNNTKIIDEQQKTIEEQKKLIEELKKIKNNKN